MNKFMEEVAGLNETYTESAKAQVRDLFKHRQALENDERQDDEGEGAHDRNSPAAHWLEDMCKNSEALLRIYIKHLATYDWTYKQLTEQAPHCLLDVEGQEQMFRELRAWAEV